jgi:hypothetical protein
MFEAHDTLVQLPVDDPRHIETPASVPQAIASQHDFRA